MLEIFQHPKTLHLHECRSQFIQKHTPCSETSISTFKFLLFDIESPKPNPHAREAKFKYKLQFFSIHHTYQCYDIVLFQLFLLTTQIQTLISLPHNRLVTKAFRLFSYFCIFQVFHSTEFIITTSTIATKSRRQSNCEFKKSEKIIQNSMGLQKKEWNSPKSNI